MLTLYKLKQSKEYQNRYDENSMILVTLWKLKFKYFINLNLNHARTVD